MALIDCPECGTPNISDQAITCPHCGFNLNEYYKKIAKIQEVKMVAQNIKKPVFPIFNISSIADILLSLGSIVLFIRIPDSVETAMMLLFTVNIIIIALIQVIFLPSILRNVKLYLLFLENERKYKIVKAKQLIWKRNKPQYAFKYILSFLIPIYGIIQGIYGFKRTDDYAYQDRNCLEIAVGTMIIVITFIILSQT